MGIGLNPISDIAHGIEHVAHDVQNDVVDPVYRDVLHPANKHVLTPLQIGSDNWVSTYHDLNNWGNDILGVLNKGQGWSQHYYRYVHDQWTRYGVLHGIGAALPIAWVFGALNQGIDKATGGAIPLGMHDTGVKETPTGQLVNPAGSATQNSWDITQEGATYRDVHGNVVTAGWDAQGAVEHLLHPSHDYVVPGYHRNAEGVEISNDADPTAPIEKQLAVPTSQRDFASGVENAIFDLYTDPTIKVGNAIKAAKVAGVVFGGEKIALSTDEVERAAQLRALDDSGKRYAVTHDGNTAFVSGRTILAPRGVKSWYDDLGRTDANNVVDIAVNNPGVWDAFDRIARMPGTAQVMQAYPRFKGMADDLAKAQTPQEVAHVFEQAVNIKNYGFLTRGLPQTSLGRRILQRYGAGALKEGELTDLSDASELDALNHGLGLATNSELAARFAGRNRAFQAMTAFHPLAVDSKTIRLSTHEADPEDPEALDAWYKALRVSRTPMEANAILAKFLEAPDLGTRVGILSNAFGDSLRVMASGKGLTDEEIRRAPQLQKWYTQGHDLVTRAMRHGYGMDRFGHPVVPVDKTDGSPLNFALNISQTGKIAFPNWNMLRRDMNTVLRSRDGIFNVGKMRGYLGLGDEWLSDHIINPFKSFVLATFGFGLRIVGSEMIPALIQNGAAAMARGTATALGAKLSYKDLLAERGARGLDGITVVTRDGATRTLKTVADDGKNALLDNGEIHPLSTLDAVHAPIPEDDIRSAAGQLGIELDDGEIHHVRAALSKALWGVADALGKEGWFYREQAKWNVLNFGGHTMSPATMADPVNTEQLGLDQANNVKKMLDKLGAETKNTRLSADNWVQWHNDKAEQPMFWHYALRQWSKDPGVRAGAHAMHDVLARGGTEEEATQAAVDADAAWQMGDSEEAQRLARSMVIRTQYNPHEFAKMRAEVVKGLTYGGGTDKANMDLLRALAGHTEVPSPLDLAKLDHADRPIAVWGRELVPPIRRLVTGGPLWATNKFWRYILDPIINGMSRSPIFTVKSGQEFRRLYPAVQAGKLSKDEAHHMAALHASQDTLLLVHNPRLRSQFSDMVRNVFPFYFAQEQAYRRYGRVALSDVSSFRKMLMVHHGLFGTGAILSDDQGNHSVVMPGGSHIAQMIAGWAAAANHKAFVGGVPVTFGGNPISLRTVVPEAAAPSVSPLVSVPLKIMEHYDPAWRGFTQHAIGKTAESESLWDSVVPNSFVRRALQTYGPLDHEAAAQTTWAYAMAEGFRRATDLRNRAANAKDPAEKARLLAEANHWMPDPATATNSQMQAAADRLRNTSRIYMAVKAVYGLFSPLAPQMEVGDVPLRQEVQDLITKHGVSQGLQEFIDKHPDATSYTVFLSDNHATGTSPPATKAALDWIDANRKFVNGHQLAAAYLVPQADGAFDSQAYNQELATGLRTRRPIVGPKSDPAAPGTFLAALYAASTDAVYYKSLAGYLAQEQQLQKSGNSYALHDLQQQFADYKENLSLANPVWAASHNDGNKVRVAQMALTDLRQTFENGHAPASPQTGYAQQLISSWDGYEQALTAIKQGAPGSQSDLKDQFNTYLDEYETSYPQAGALITGIFRRLVND